MMETQPSAGPGMTPPLRLVTTLGGLGAVAGLLIVVVFSATRPAIEAYRAATLHSAINEVLGNPDRYDTLYVIDGAITGTPPAGATLSSLEAVYLGYRDGRPIGFAIHATGQGFQDAIGLIFGYDAATSTLLGMKVLESKETPGLGDKIYKDAAFVAEFSGATVPLVGVKAGGGPGTPNEVAMITGATISSRALIKAINAAIEHFGPMLAAYQKGQRP